VCLTGTWCVCGCAVHACPLEASNWMRPPPSLPGSPRFLSPPILRSGTTPDKSERLASRQSTRRPDPLGFFFPKRRRSSQQSSPDPTPATPKPSSNPFKRFRVPSRSSTVPTPAQPPPLRTATTMTAAPTFDHYRPQSPPALHGRSNLKAWWERFTFAQRAKKEAEERKGVHPLCPPSLDVSVPIRRSASPTPHTPKPERRFWQTAQGQS
jgi:hypothetical protein